VHVVQRPQGEGGQAGRHVDDPLHVQLLSRAAVVVAFVVFVVVVVVVVDVVVVVVVVVVQLAAVQKINTSTPHIIQRQTDI
jgi:hypothetical protein